MINLDLNPLIKEGEVDSFILQELFKTVQDYLNGGQETGGGIGDVLGPATNTNNNIPQWSGTNSKTLKDGRAIGIAQTNLAQVSAADVANGEYAKFTATGLESKTKAEVLIDIIPVFPGLTAHATGGQADATALIKGINNISTCATQLDSCKLMATCAVGDIVEVSNNGARVANIYPASGDNFVGSAPNIPIPLMKGNTLRFICTVADTTWELLTTGWQESAELDLTITGVATAWTSDIQKATFRYKDGVWHADYSINGRTTVATRTVYAITITGVAHALGTTVFPSIEARTQSADFYPTAGRVLGGGLSATAASYSTAYYSWNGRVRLASMPTSYI